MAESPRYTIKSLIFDHDQDPDHIAVESPGNSPLTYRDLRIQVLYVVNTLHSQGFRRNDRIALITPAGPETAVMMVSVMAGFSCVLLNPQLTKPEYEMNFLRLKVKAVVIQPGFETAAATAAGGCNVPIIKMRPVLGKAGIFTLDPAASPGIAEPEFATPSDISHVLLTSGTTARPKIVPISQQQSVIARYRQVQTLQITAHDRCLQILPYFHGMGFGIPVLGTLLAGGTIICTRDFIPSDFISLLDTYRPTFFIAGPTHHQAILRGIQNGSPASLRSHSLRLILSSSASMPDDVRHELETLLGVPVIDQYASTETGVISINFPPRTGSVGKPVIDHLAVLDENGRCTGPHEEGEIVVRGETLFCGYEDDPEENKVAFINGWFRTGDLGYLDNDGFLFLTGRGREVINKGGEKISPEEIDAVLRSHAGVRDAMAFPVQDPVLGEDFAAMVVLADDRITETDLRNYLLDLIIPSRLPRRIFFVDKIPRNPAGKPLRHVGTQGYSRGDESAHFKDNEKN
ncbi:MAG: AMP-binding protein [Methanoregula sp.]|nr:AMP-binding protein [Methanoregula sp.]